MWPVTRTPDKALRPGAARANLVPVDESRRASERAAARGDGAAWWIAQLRSGAIARADLELAAWVGDEDARQALGPSVFAANPPSLEHLIRGLGRWGLPIMVQAIWCIAEPRLGALELEAPTIVGALRKGVLAWCRGPSDVALERITRTVHALYERGTESPSFEAFRDLQWSALLMIGTPGPWFNQGARDPRRETKLSLLQGTPTPGVEASVRELLLSLARSGASLAWVGRCKVPSRPCPSPSPEPADDARVAALSPTDLELAAWLGEPTARRLLGSSALCRWPGTQGWPQGALAPDELVDSDVLAWLRDVGRWGRTWRDLAQRALGRVALRLLEPRADSHAKARRLLDAADGGAAAATLRGMLDEALLVQKLIGDPSGLSSQARLVEEAVALASGAEWSEAQWSGRQSMGVHVLRSDPGAVVEAVRAALLPRLLESSGSGRGSVG